MTRYTLHVLFYSFHSIPPHATLTSPWTESARSAHSVRLLVLALQTVVIGEEIRRNASDGRANECRAPAHREGMPVGLSVTANANNPSTTTIPTKEGIEKKENVLLLLLKLLGIKLVERLQGELEIRQQGVTARLGEVLTHDNAHQFHLVRVGCHCVGRDDPATLTELVGTGTC